MPLSFGIGVAGCAQHGNKDLRFPDFSRTGVYDWHGLPGVVHKQLLACLVIQPHGSLDLPGPITI